MQPFKRYVSFVAASLVIVTATVVHGLWTDRWVLSQELQSWVDKLPNVPMNAGDWQGRVLEFAQRDMELTRSAGGELRQYTNRLSGEILNVMILCGRPGAMVVHTPEVCYRGAGFEKTFGPAPWSLQID